MVDNKPGLDRNELDNLLSGFIKKGYLTVSDKELLKLREKDSNLTVVESGDYFMWEQSEGVYYNIVTGRDFDKKVVSSFNNYLDISTIDINKLAVQDDAYMLAGGLECVIEGVNGTLKGPDFGKLGLNLYTNGGVLDLSKYKLSMSARIREFYSVDKGLRVSEEKCPFNSTSLVARLSGKDEISIVYRITYSGNSEIGSRLYLKTSQSSAPLNKDRNENIIDFMKHLYDLHRLALSETSCDVEKFGHKPNYLDMYR
ncbi:MAG: hypothetical protein M1433_00250 [Candidatus Parvarchaeota archaeon]|nr:hypothetical protein [Candidatus Parvarchaeota archaeon]